jgi:hypothetical protein
MIIIISTYIPSLKRLEIYKSRAVLSSSVHPQKLLMIFILCLLLPGVLGQTLRITFFVGGTGPVGSARLKTIVFLTNS